MSITQRNAACPVVVDWDMAAAIRTQTIVVLEANHHYFEDVEEFGPEAQYALSVIYRDAFAVLDALGWDPAAPASGDTVEIPLTEGHVEQLRRRRFELGHANIDRLEHAQGAAGARADIDRDRATAQALDRLFGVWSRARAGDAED